MLKINGLLIPLKADVDEELLSSQDSFNKLKCKLLKKEEFLLPKENSKRTILKIKKIGRTNEMYPRKFSEIKKKSL